MISHTFLFFPLIIRKKTHTSFPLTNWQLLQFNYSTETKQNAFPKDLIVYFDVFPAVSGAVSPQPTVCFHFYQMKMEDVPAAFL